MRDYDTKNKQLVASWNATKDIRVKREIEDMLVRHNRFFLYKVSSKYPHEIDEIDDLFNECAKSVIPALQQYDQTLGKCKFISFWVWKMRSAIGHFIYHKEKCNAEIMDCTIMGKNHTQDGNYGILADQPAYDSRPDDTVDKLLDNPIINDRERRICKAFYSELLSVDQISHMEGVSKQMISLIMAGARKKLKTEFTRGDKWKKYSLQYS